MKFSNRCIFYFKKSLCYYIYSRLRSRLGIAAKKYPKEIECHSVRLSIDGLPSQMKDYLIDGRYENAEIALLSKHLSGHEKVLEIGAAIGLVGLYCRSVLKVESLVSVEPNPYTIERLRANYTLNQLEPRLMEAAIAAVDGQIRLHVSEMFWTDSMIQGEDHSEGRVITVPSYTLSSLVHRCGFDVDALIMDVEGAEQYVKGEDIPSTVSLMLVELHPQLIGAKSAFGFLNEAVRAGFGIEDQLGDVWLLRRKTSC